jgi:BCL2-associated athanogene 2
VYEIDHILNFKLNNILLFTQTVDINVQTVRDHFQVDSLHVVNHLIDEVIRFGDPILKRKRCQEYLNACSTDFQYSITTINEDSTSRIIDKKFEGFLLGCTLDDQKRIKKRLENLLSYMAMQMVKMSE